MVQHCVFVSEADASLIGARDGLHSVSPHPGPTPALSPGESENGPPTLDHTHAGVCQPPSAKHQSHACCSLSLRERGKYSVERATCSFSKRPLSNRRRSRRPKAQPTTVPRLW